MIHPRRLKGSASNIARYYAIGDYYSKGAGEHSEWGGAIAADLHLEGKVDPGVLRDLLAGRVAGQQLGRLLADGSRQHHPGWDFAVNAPKSVSIMALVAGDGGIIEAHEQAVTRALVYLEEHAALRRRIDGEVTEKTTGRLLFARFSEHASRELDPHLHTHVVVLNVTSERSGDRFASLETRAMYAEQMVAGQVYRNELAHLLRERGYEVDFDPRKGLFEIRGVPKDLIADMSRRSAQIDAHAREHGLEGQAARRKSFYETRGAKEKVSLEALHERWRGRLGPHAEQVHHTRAEADKISPREVAVEPMLAARAMLFGLRQSEGSEAVNNLGRLLKTALASHVGEVRLDDVHPLAREHECRHKVLAVRHPTGDEVHTRGRTSRATVRLELALADHLVLALGDAKPIAAREALGVAGARHGLTPEQRLALDHLGLSTDRVTGLHGVAGSGKSTLVAALREAAGARTTLVALAPTSSAAAELGNRAGIESRTVASLLATGGRSLGEDHALIVDEAGQLGNRQAVRLLEISRATGARLMFLGDTHQTGPIEQGKPFWLMLRLGLSSAHLRSAVRQENDKITRAVTLARSRDYAGSLNNLDAVRSGGTNEELAKAMVGEWTRLRPENRARTNMLVLENATRLIVNSKVRETLKVEGAVAAEETRLAILSPAGMTAQEKHFARFYTRGQVVVFSRDDLGLGIARDAEYRVQSAGRNGRGRQVVTLVDEKGRRIDWDPRLGRASRINVFKEDVRNLAGGDRIQWRLVNHELGIRNAERGTVERIDGTIATIRWDRDARVQDLDLSVHRTWDHGYCETVYSAQSKTYDRVFVLAPVASPLVTGQNFYTAITRARFGAKLWTEDRDRLVDRLLRRSGEKTSGIEGLGRIGRDSAAARAERHHERLARIRESQIAQRRERGAVVNRSGPVAAGSQRSDVPIRLAEDAHSIVQIIDRWLRAAADRHRGPDDKNLNAGESERQSAGGKPDRSLAAPRSGGDSHER
ncbi:MULTISPECIES: MobF family relaxase [Novosphingobium]|uniref:MobF family relaxase n=1 Tax=Novosphingobium TaxID=165696 RepID=UPI0022F24E9A|nr:MobF family relaxase [Novosphingobium resinovorum]GLK43944.1 conjugative relaxase [Novosphingobium resinovorum]